MVCHQCGSPVSSKDKTCSNCGAALKQKRRRLESQRLERMTSKLKAVTESKRLLPAGEVISKRFELGDLIGAGPLGEVYRANDSLIDTEVAVKIFDPVLIEDPRAQERFINATRRARGLTQANVVRIHDSGVHSGTHPWVSMQALEGLTLRKLLDMREARGERFNLEEAEPIVTQITLALQHINREFPVGDLKPGNILLMRETLKLTDIFVGAAVSADILGERLQESRYLAPELRAGEEDADARADVYSLGVILGEMVFGANYKPGEAQVAPNQRATDALCRRACAQERDERYDSVEMLSEDFASLVDTGRLIHAEVVRERQPSLPPPAPAAGQSSGKVAPPTLPGPSINEDPEAEIETREYLRDGEPPADLADYLETRDVQRDQADSARVDTAEAVAAAKPMEPSQATPPYLVAAAVVVFLAAAVAVVWFTTGGEAEEVVTIADNTSRVEAEDEVGPEPRREATPDPSVRVSAAVEAALNGTQGALASGRERAVSQQAPVLKAEEAGALAEAEQAGGEGAREGVDEPTSEASSKRQGAPRKPSAADAAREPAKPAHKGTECPSGMALVKRKAGNYCIDRYEYPGRGQRPKTNVSWFDAKRICGQASKRLCSISEWRRACGSTYPYGRKWDPDKCNTADEDGFERSLAAAGSFKECRNRRGLYDMTGNAHEWTSDQKIAGGGFDSDEDVATCRYSSAKGTSSSAPTIGFRCCADPE